MLEFIEVAPKVLGLVVKGKIHESDIKKVIELCEKKMETADRIAVYVEVEDMDGITFNAFIEDMKFALPNFKRFSKKAVVSDKKWHETMARIGDKIFPSIDVKHFKPEERDTALEWVKE